MIGAKTRNNSAAGLHSPGTATGSPQNDASELHRVDAYMAKPLVEQLNAYWRCVRRLCTAVAASPFLPLPSSLRCACSSRRPTRREKHRCVYHCVGALCIRGLQKSSSMGCQVKSYTAVKARVAQMAIRAQPHQIIEAR